MEKGTVVANIVVEQCWKCDDRGFVGVPVVGSVRSVDGFTVWGNETIRMMNDETLVRVAGQYECADKDMCLGDILDLLLASAKRRKNVEWTEVITRAKYDDTEAVRLCVQAYKEWKFADDGYLNVPDEVPALES